MTYEDLAYFAQTWGLVFLVILFAIAIAYALWPANKNKFKRAANIPLHEDEKENGK